MNAVAMQRAIELPNDSIVESTGALCGDMKKLDLFLAVELKVKTPAGMDKATMKSIVDKASEVSSLPSLLHPTFFLKWQWKQVCPYSRAVKGNIEVKLTLE